MILALRFQLISETQNSQGEAQSLMAAVLLNRQVHQKIKKALRSPRAFAISRCGSRTNINAQTKSSSCCWITFLALFDYLFSFKVNLDAFSQFLKVDIKTVIDYDYPDLSEPGPEPSCVSFKSNQSNGRLINFSDQPSAAKK